MIYSVIFIFLYALANALRGSGIKWTPKWLLGLILGIASYSLLDTQTQYCDYLLPCVIAFGFMMSFSKGWSHMALHGWLDTKKKFPLISDFLNKHYKTMRIAPKLQEEGSKMWGILFMTCYAALLQYPQFITIGMFTESIAPILIGIGVLLKGVIMYIVGVTLFKVIGEHSLRVFEFLYGAWLRLLITLSLG